MPNKSFDQNGSLVTSNVKLKTLMLRSSKYFVFVLNFFHWMTFFFMYELSPKIFPKIFFWSFDNKSDNMSNRLRSNRKEKKIEERFEMNNRKTNSFQYISNNFLN